MCSPCLGHCTAWLVVTTTVSQLQYCNSAQATWTTADWGNIIKFSFLQNELFLDFTETPRHQYLVPDLVWGGGARAGPHLIIFSSKNSPLHFCIQTSQTSQAWAKYNVLFLPWLVGKCHPIYYKLNLVQTAGERYFRLNMFLWQEYEADEITIRMFDLYVFTFDHISGLCMPKYLLYLLINEIQRDSKRHTVILKTQI